MPCLKLHNQCADKCFVDDIKSLTGWIGWEQSVTHLTKDYLTFVGVTISCFIEYISFPMTHCLLGLSHASQNSLVIRNCLILGDFMHHININQYINFYNLFFTALITSLFCFKQWWTENIDRGTGRSNDKGLEESEGKQFFFPASILITIVSCLMCVIVYSLYLKKDIMVIH